MILAFDGALSPTASWNEFLDVFVHLVESLGNDADISPSIIKDFSERCIIRFDDIVRSLRILCRRAPSVRLDAHTWNGLIIKLDGRRDVQPEQETETLDMQSRFQGTIKRHQSQTPRIVLGAFRKISPGYLCMFCSLHMYPH